MSKKTILLFLSSIFVYGCVNNDIQVVNPSVKPQVSPSLPDVKPSEPSVVNPSILPSPSISYSPSSVPTQIPEVSPTPVKSSLTTLSLGLNNPYKRITDTTIKDDQIELIDVSENLVEIKPEFIIIDLKQELIDLNYSLKVEWFKWRVYDEILSKVKDNNTKIYFRINYTRALNDNSYPTLSRYKEYLNEVVKKYKNYNINWIVGDSINDKNLTVATSQEYLNFLKESYGVIKNVDQESMVFMGSMVQAEVFGKPSSYLADNFLSYLNLGAGEYCDGFIFKILSLDIENKYTDAGSSNLSGTDYKLIGTYSNLIQGILKMKNIQNKKLILETGTYGPDTVNGVYQSEQQQANDIFRRVIYASSLGFSNIFLPEYHDKASLENANFYRKIGIISTQNVGPEEKKLSYYMYKFISEKLNGAIFNSKIENLPANIEGYLYTKNNKNYYILWNLDKSIEKNVSLKINTNKGTLFKTPSIGDINGLSSSFTTDENNVYSVSFYLYPLNPRIIETEN